MGYRIARQVGTDDVDGLLARHSVSSLREWQVALRLDPPVEERVDVMIGQLCCMVANRLRGKDEDPYELQDFIVDWAADPDEQKRKRHEKNQEKLKAKMEMAKVKRLLMGED